tara:strand:+ start:224 stop:394 length:171 start_codon:yes stop_codon:yes gene_type:complete
MTAEQMRKRMQELKAKEILTPTEQKELYDLRLDIFGPLKAKGSNMKIQDANKKFMA